MSLITLEDISKTHARIAPVAVSHVSFTLREREILALLGPSGSGKTTTLRMIAGFDRPDSGRILLNGAPLSGDGMWIEPEKRRIGMVFQDYALFPHLTLLENVMFGLRGESRKEREDTARRVLKVVDMDDMAARYPHEISGGQQQRVALARALAPNPLVLLLDEPFSNLDSDMRAEMREELLRILRESDTSAIIVTHDQEEAFTLADRVGILNRGVLEQISEPEVLYRQPGTRFVAEFVGRSDFIRGGGVRRHRDRGREVPQRYRFAGRYEGRRPGAAGRGGAGTRGGRPRRGDAPAVSRRREPVPSGPAVGRARPQQPTLDVCAGRRHPCARDGAALGRHRFPLRRRVLLTSLRSIDLKRLEPPAGLEPATY